MSDKYFYHSNFEVAAIRPVLKINHNDFDQSLLRYTLHDWNKLVLISSSENLLIKEKMNNENSGKFMYIWKFVSMISITCLWKFLIQTDMNNCK